MKLLLVRDFYVSGWLQKQIPSDITKKNVKMAKNTREKLSSCEKLLAYQFLNISVLLQHVCLCCVRLRMETKSRDMQLCPHLSHPWHKLLLLG